MKKSRVLLRSKTITNGAMGQTVKYTPSSYKYASVIPLDAKTIAAYQQQNTNVTHKVIFSQPVTITIGDNDILWGSKTLTPVTPAQIIDGNTIILVSE